MTPLTRLVYRSDSNISHDNTEALDAIFRVSTTHNKKDGLTGALALPDGKFVQVIEGDATPLDALMERIERDTRHTDVTVLGRWPITARLFGSWAMARPDPTPLSDQAFRIVTEVGSGAQVTSVLLDLMARPEDQFFSTKWL